MMEDIFFLIVDFIDAFIPNSFKEWVFAKSKPIQYILKGILYVFVLIVFAVIIILICLLFNKITGFCL